MGVTIESYGKLEISYIILITSNWIMIETYNLQFDIVIGHH